MSLRALLEGEAAKALPRFDDDCITERYTEHTNDAALTRQWLDDGTSYIWRVGVLTQIDSNKCDYARAFIGYERAPGRFQYIGMLNWDEGENDDLGRFFARIGATIAANHPAFER